MRAIVTGYRMIDTSGDYGTQPGIAQGIKASGIERDKLYIVTKVEENEDAYESARKNVEELQIGYADLILIHRPPADGDAGEKLWEGLIRAKEKGITTDIGVSNYAIEDLETLRAKFSDYPVVNQIEWSPFGHNKDIFDYCKTNEIIIQAYSPLTRAERLDNPRLQEIADKYAKTPAQILTRWNLQLGTVPLPKANNIDHLEEDIDVFDFELSPYDMELLTKLNEHYSALESLPYV